MIRRTSIEAYQRIKDDGLLSKRRWQIYDIVFRYGPVTANQVLSYFRKEYEPELNSGVATTRLSELRDRGLIFEVKTVPCPMTGYSVILWDVTDNLPVQFDKPQRQKCRACNGKGYFENHQSRLFK